MTTVPIGSAPSTQDGYTWITGVSSAGQTPFPGVPPSTPVLRRIASPQSIYDIPQVVNLVYQGCVVSQVPILRNDPVNRTDFYIVRNLENEVFFRVVDGARDALSGATLTFNLVDQTVLLQRNLTPSTLGRGLYLLTLTEDDTADLPLTTLRWSVSYLRDDGVTVMLWTENASPYSVARVVTGPVSTTSSRTLVWSDFSPLTAAPNSVFPINSSLPVTSATLPTPDAPPQYYSAALVGSAQQPYTTGMQVFTLSMTDFKGTVRIDGSLTDQPHDDPSWPDWFEVASNDYTSITDTVTVSVEGRFVWMRLVVTPKSGSLDQVDFVNDMTTTWFNSVFLGLSSTSGSAGQLTPHYDTSAASAGAGASGSSGAVQTT